VQDSASQTNQADIAEKRIYIKKYRNEANKFSFKRVPFSKVKAIQYASEQQLKIKFKLSFSDNNWTEINYYYYLA